MQEITAKEVEMNVLNMIECHESTLECMFLWFIVHVHDGVLLRVI